MTVNEMILDMDADFMENAFRLVDEQLETLNEIIRDDLRGQGDSAFFDDAEYIYGLGFVLGQRYLTSTCGAFKIVESEDRRKACALGPQTKGVGTALLVDAAANYWKHSDEWDHQNLSKGQNRTKETIEKVGVKVGFGEYVGSNVFAAIGLKKFQDLIPLLKTWSNAVETAQNSKS